MRDCLEFQPPHLEVFWRRIASQDELLICGMTPLELGVSCVQQGRARTFVVDGQIIAIIGVKQLWTGVLDAYAFMSPEASRHALWLTRFTLNGISALFSRYKVRRIQCDIREDNTKSLRWVKWLGFREEGTMIYYGPDGSTFKRYALIRH